MARAETVVEDGAVYVRTRERRIAVGDLEHILDLVGGRAWTISYSEREKRHHPELDTSDEGLTVDVVDTIEAMTFDRAFVETLAAQPAEPVAASSTERSAPAEDAVSPRLGLFVGRLLENLEYGVR